jgi:septal ring factor EnvC (AmiA/AmiB activator)
MKAFTQSVLFVVFFSNTIFAVSLDSSINVIEKTNTKLNTYQKKINKSEDERLELFNEYKYVNQLLRNTKNYNAQLEKIISSQEKELASLDEQISDIKETQKRIFPLMKEMVISLKTLVEEDTPFLMTERRNRVARLEKALDSGNIKNHEKYRIILEAFKIEYDYAKTIESYQDKINDKTFNFLRLGRVSLYAQSLDLKEYFYFNTSVKNWEEIDDSTAKSNIRKGIKIAKKQQNIDFLTLPFLANKDVK